ncbi:cytochrome c oxidase assembly protein Rcf1 [Schizosaccharomyces osmophilus]|uniref:Cytochrome c oxidase assembly protein Rcf1 n=1 Tax=Schizosaccharomyces osmophilus TaxID=2545709 RepID=A0AAE9WFH0_9SCHI|nr:cytochrome c oxidase assembly protein Rcf1 [Schizosaccharomyces osmophilus]WBW75210.1 cytochrome c oxidase assembly protein Rcf1 [Schizosaccharomyces osmophilus]
MSSNPVEQKQEQAQMDSIIKPSSQETTMSRSEKLTYVLVHNPLIPLGCVMTVGTFLVSGYHLRKGNELKANRFMKYRVLSQGFTLAAVAFGVLFMNPKPKPAPPKPY